MALIPGAISWASTARRVQEDLLWLADRPGLKVGRAGRALVAESIVLRGARRQPLRPGDPDRVALGRGHGTGDPVPPAIPYYVWQGFHEVPGRLNKVVIRPA